MEERLAMNLPANPIFVFDVNGKDVAAYASVAEAEGHLEAVDVRNSEYEAFDAEGRLLHLTVEKRNGFWSLGREVVRIAPAEAEPSHAGELCERLSAFLKATDLPILGPRVPLSELVEAVLRITSR